VSGVRCQQQAAEVLLTTFIPMFPDSKIALQIIIICHLKSEFCPKFHFDNLYYEKYFRRTLVIIFMYVNHVSLSISL